jgi:chromosome segregation ATPase
MTQMSRVTLALTLALFLGACAANEPPTGSNAASTEAVEALEARILELEAQVADDLEAEGSDRAKLEGRLDRLADKLERSLDRLREALGGVKSGSADARDAADSALATARSVASDLTVLEERYDYHLRRYHGGGG